MYTWKPGDCDYCGVTPEDWEHWNNEPLTLVEFHGDHICPNCMALEREDAERDAANSIVTMWFDGETERA